MALLELQELKKELTRHDYRYYILFKPIISDQAYDMMYKEYEQSLVTLVGLDTKSNEDIDCYPQWVKDELGTERHA